MDDKLKKVPARFWKSKSGSEPVREWLSGLNREDRKTIGTDVSMVEYGWPVGMPTCRPLGDGLFEVRSDLTEKRIGRVFFCFYGGYMILLHGIIKKTQKTPDQDLKLARERKRELER